MLAIMLRQRTELGGVGRGMVARVPQTADPELELSGAPDPGSTSSSSVRFGCGGSLQLRELA